jgi:hypothetical protein
VLVAPLGEDAHRHVLLLEAGPVYQPRQFSAIWLMRADHDWEYLVSPAALAIRSMSFAAKCSAEVLP